MIDRINGWGGVVVAAGMAVIGMFYRHGSAISAIEAREIAKAKAQDDTNERLQDWMEKMSKQLGDIRVELARLKGPHES